MTFHITWTDNAQEDLQQILNYLTKNWSEKDADNFLEKLFLRIDILLKSPLIGKKSDKLSSVRRIVNIPDKLYIPFRSKLYSSNRD